MGVSVTDPEAEPVDKKMGSLYSNCQEVVFHLMVVPEVAALSLVMAH
jgi:hypothetical protein